MESISFACECGKKFKTQAANAGRRSKCPACGRALVVPAASQTEDVWELDDAPEPEPEPAPVPAQAPPARPDPEYYAAPKAPLTDTSATEGKALAALGLGILSIFLGLLAGLPAVVLGVLGMRRVQRGGGAVRGEWQALTGIALGGVPTIVSVVALAVYVILLPQIAELRGSGQGPPPLGQGSPPVGFPAPPAEAAPPDGSGFPPPPDATGFPPPPPGAVLRTLPPAAPGSPRP